MAHESDDPSTTGRHFPDLRVVKGSVGSASWVVSTRLGGVSRGDFAESNLADHVGDDASHVSANRRALADQLGASAGLAVIRAEHGRNIARVTESGDVPGVDAVTTSRAGLGLVALGADCAVIGLVGVRVDGAVVVSAVHCGWRGLVCDVVGEAVAFLWAEDAQSIQGIVGPAICGHCYLVSTERVAAVRAQCDPEVAEQAIVTTASGPGIDVAQGVRSRLEQLGVQVDAPFGCTYEGDEWFSFRRSTDQGVMDGRTGRHALGIVVR